MNDIGFIFLLILIIIFAVLIIILFTHILQCICMVCCYKTESINTLHIRTIENPINNLPEKNNSIVIHIEEDPETVL